MKNKKNKANNEQQRFTDGYTHSFIPSALSFAPIFAPKTRGAKAKIGNREHIELSSNRTKTEVLSYVGPRLDVTLDFQLFFLIISKAIKAQNTKIQLGFHEIFFLTNKKKSTVLKQEIAQRLEQFMCCYFELKLYADERKLSPPIREIKTSFISRIEFDSEDEIFHITVCEDLLLEDTSDDSIRRIQRDLIKLDYINNIPSDSAKCLFLFIESKWFTELPYVMLSHQELIDRLNSCSNTQRQKNRQVKDALETLKDALYLCHYEFGVDRMTGKKVVKVLPIKREERYEQGYWEFKNKRLKKTSQQPSRYVKHEYVKAKRKAHKEFL